MEEHCHNAHCFGQDNNSKQWERLHIGIVCYNLLCRLVAAADDNKLVAVLELQSMTLPKAFYLLLEKCDVRNSQLHDYVRHEIQRLRLMVQ